jgi:hypothetical protein
VRAEFPIEEDGNVATAGSETMRDCDLWVAVRIGETRGKRKALPCRELKLRRRGSERRRRTDRI